MSGPKPYGNFFQYVAAFLGNLLTISYGYMIGITASMLVLYKSADTPLLNGPLLSSNLSWITTLFYLGAIIGTIFFQHLSDCFGRRSTLLLVGIIQNMSTEETKLATGPITLHGDPSQIRIGSKRGESRRGTEEFKKEQRELTEILHYYDHFGESLKAVDYQIRKLENWKRGDLKQYEIGTGRGSGMTDKEKVELEKLGWFGVAFGHNYFHICISRCLVGLTAGGALVVLPIFLTEISQTLRTDTPFITTLAFQSCGVMLGSIVGTLLDYTITSLVGLIISVLFSLTFPFVQESPYYYIRKSDINMLEKSLRYFRAIRDIDQRLHPSYVAEVKKFKSLVKMVEVKVNRSTWETFQAFFVSFIAIIIAQLCGILITQDYASIIFEQTESIFSVAWSLLLLTIVGFVGTLLSVFIILWRWQKKSIVCLFSMIISTCLATLGYFLKFNHSLEYNYKVDWIPFATLCALVLLVNASIYPITFIVIAELFPSKRTNLWITFLYVLYWTTGLLLTKFHFNIVVFVEIHMYCWIVSGLCLFQGVTSIFLLPRKELKLITRTVNNVM